MELGSNFEEVVSALCVPLQCNECHSIKAGGSPKCSLPIKSILVPVFLSSIHGDHPGSYFPTSSKCLFKALPTCIIYLICPFYLLVSFWFLIPSSTHDIDTVTEMRTYGKVPTSQMYWPSCKNASLADSTSESKVR